MIMAKRVILRYKLWWKTYSQLMQELLHYWHRTTTSLSEHILDGVFSPSIFFQILSNLNFDSMTVI